MSADVVHVSDRPPADPAELPPRSHLDRACAELEREEPWDVDLPDRSGER